MIHNIYRCAIGKVIFVIRKMHIWIIIVSLLFCLMKDVNDES